MTITLRQDERIEPAIEACAQFMAERGIDIDSLSEQRVGYLIFAALIKEIAKLRDDAGLS